MPLPDYHGASLVNLMASLSEGLEGPRFGYAPTPLLPPAEVARWRNVVLLVIDGLGYELLAQLADASWWREGLRGRLTSVFPSTTATAITTFLTGQAPQQHAITGWHIYFEEHDCLAAVLPYKRRGDGQPLHKLGLRPNQVFDQRPLFEALPVASFVIAPEAIVNSEYNHALTRGTRRYGYSTAAEMARRIERILREPHAERRYLYAYYPVVDRLSHDHGPYSQHVAGCLRGLEQTLRDTFTRLRGTDTLFVITADHGQIPTAPQRCIEVADHPPLVAALRLPLAGERRTPYCYVHPERRADFEAYTQHVLGEYLEVYPRAEALARGWYGLGEPHPRLSGRIGDYVLLMKENYILKDWMPGEQRYSHLGVHGGMSEEEMYVPLLVFEC